MCLACRSIDTDFLKFLALDKGEHYFKCGIARVKGKESYLLYGFRGESLFIVSAMTDLGGLSNNQVNTGYEFIVGASWDRMGNVIIHNVQKTPHSISQLSLEKILEARIKQINSSLSPTKKIGSYLSSLGKKNLERSA